MKLRSWIVCLAATVFVSAAAYAGMTLTMRCSSCGFSARVNFGGGFTFDQLTGYCANCSQFVYLTWERGKKAPTPLGQVWDSATGKTIPLYPCPHCSKPFMPLQAELKHCPKCGKPTFERDEAAGTLLYD